MLPHIVLPQKDKFTVWNLLRILRCHHHWKRLMALSPSRQLYFRTESIHKNIYSAKLLWITCFLWKINKQEMSWFWLVFMTNDENVGLKMMVHLTTKKQLHFCSTQIMLIVHCPPNCQLQVVQIGCLFFLLQTTKCGVYLGFISFCSVRFFLAVLMPHCLQLPDTSPSLLKVLPNLFSCNFSCNFYKWKVIQGFLMCILKMDFHCP